ncbi:hypothetical protein QLH32_05645 [Acinetobacter corruptisaponis]|uniref:Uncharacterized protein n=1 Tax=Acinetobacter corruptisaponis TaxID=3045147 RepID=A0ABY8S648_9GAMM|nr:hypothetical protein [Acinetobacter sp. KCTC 92772]WHP06871.1 hypothetical protein QLH32_05215 [Acinetobacter sp. KCTC 92772]WHP06949.1 hypothetical protein QLH32_05645 [Acinetobacter sp. KCTC 92772]
MKGVRTLWRQILIFKMLKVNLLLGKKSVDELIADAKKIESFVFQKNIHEISSEASND